MRHKNVIRKRIYKVVSTIVFVSTRNHIVHYNYESTQVIRYLDYLSYRQYDVNNKSKDLCDDIDPAHDHLLTGLLN